MPEFWVPETAQEWILACFMFIPGFLSVFMGILYGWAPAKRQFLIQEARVDRLLNTELLLGTNARLVIVSALVASAMLGLMLGIFLGWMGFFFFGFGIGLAIGHFMLRKAEIRRRRKLNDQIVDGITTLASAVRAGLTLVQAYQLLIKNGAKEISQEVAQMMREYELGIDLNQAMRNTSQRIGSSYYRLLFAAVEAHRQRGGDMGDSLDRIADSIREIIRLEGRLDSLTAQGRSQANMMAVMPFVIMFIYWMIDPTGVESLLTEPFGRLLILLSAGLIGVGFYWIRRIMAVDL